MVLKLLIVSSYLLTNFAFLISILYVYKHRSLNVFYYIFLAQFGIFSLVACYSIFYFLGEPLPGLLKDLLEFTMVFGHVSGLLGVFIWFMAMEILDFDENKIKNIFMIRFIYLIIGVTVGLNIFSLGYKWNPIWGNYDLTFTYQLGFILTPFIYAFYLFHQFSLFYFKTRHFESFIRFPYLKGISYIYYLSILIAIITFTLGGLNLIPSFTWIFFGAISQLVFSYFLLKIPLVLLTSEIPVRLIILSNLGFSIHLEEFDKTLKVSEQLFAGYLTAINQIGTGVLIDSGSGNVTKVNVGEKGEKITLIFYSLDDIRFCYIYKGKSYYSSTRLENFAKNLCKNERLWQVLQNCAKNRRVLQDKNLFEPHIDNYFKDYLDY